MSPLRDYINHDIQQSTPGRRSPAKAIAPLWQAPTLSTTPGPVADYNHVQTFVGHSEPEGVGAAMGFETVIADYEMLSNFVDLHRLNLPSYLDFNGYTGAIGVGLDVQGRLHDISNGERPLLPELQHTGGGQARWFAKRSNRDLTVYKGTANPSWKMMYNSYSKKMEYFEFPTSSRTTPVKNNLNVPGSPAGETSLTFYVGKKLLNPGVYQRFLDIQTGTISDDQINEGATPFWKETIKLAKALAAGSLSDAVITSSANSLLSQYNLTDSDFNGSKAALTSAMSGFATAYGNVSAELLNLATSRTYRSYGRTIATLTEFEGFLLTIANFIDKQLVGSDAASSVTVAQAAGQNSTEFLNDANAIALLSDTQWTAITTDAAGIDTPFYGQFIQNNGSYIFPNGLKVAVPANFTYSNKLLSNNLFANQANAAEQATNQLFNETSTRIEIGFSWVYAGINYSPIVHTFKEDHYGIAGHLVIPDIAIPRGVIGCCLWKNTLDNAEDWQLIDQQFFDDWNTDLIQINEAQNQSEDTADYVFTEQTIASSDEAGQYRFAFRADQSQSALFGDVCGFTGQTLAGYQQFLSYGNLGITAGGLVPQSDGALQSRNDLLHIVPINSAGTLQEFCVPVNAAVQIPELTDDDLYGLIRLDRYVALITDRMISLFQPVGGGLQHVRNIFGAAPTNRWAWAHDGLSIYSLAEDGLFQISPNGKQRMELPFNFEDLTDPKLHFDRERNELVVISEANVYCIGRNGIYQRDWSGANITFVRDWGGRLAVSSTTSTILTLSAGLNEPSDTLSVISQPMYLGSASSTKRVTDLWLTFMRQSPTNPQSVIVKLYGDANDTQLSEIIDLSAGPVGEPFTIRLRLKRVLKADKLPVDNPVWTLTEFTEGADTYIREFSINAANRPSRWFRVELASIEATGLFLQDAQIGFNDYGAR